MDRKPLILVADDEPEIIKLYRAKLEMSGFDVVTAEDGAAAVRTAKEKKPDLVLMDVKMPQLDGVAAFNELKADPETNHIKVLFLTAFSDNRLPEVDVKFAEEAGAAAFMRKGEDLDMVVEAIRTALQK